MRIKSNAAFLFSLLVLLPVSTPAQTTYDQARGALTRGDRSPDTAVRREALAALRDCGDRRLVREILNIALRIDRDVAKLDDRIQKTGSEVERIFRSIDRQGDAGRPVTVGTAQSAIKKYEEVQRILSEQMREKDAALDWRSGLIGTAGAIFRNLPAADQMDVADELLREISRARDFPVQSTVLDILARSRAESARVAIAGLFSTSNDGALRTAIVDALAWHPSPANLNLYASALKDEVWTVRVAAAHGLKQVLHPGTVEILVAALPNARGRTLEEYLAVLEIHAGVTFHDNATLWQEWWAERGDAIKETYESIQSSELPSRLQGAARARDSGVLLLARTILARAGVGPDRPVEAASPEELPESDRAALEIVSKEAIGSIVSSRPERIRNLAADMLAVRPFVRERRLDGRIAILDWTGRIDATPVRNLLTTLAGERGIENPETGQAYPEAARDRLRTSAVRALGHHDHEDAVRALEGILTGASANATLRKEAVAALLSGRTKGGVAALIQGLRNRDQQVKDSCREALVQLTGQGHPAEYQTWIGWWRSAEKDFTPRGAVAKTEEKEAARPKDSGTTFYGIESRSQHVVFILDRSGSMNATDKSGGTKWNTAKEELTKAIVGLKDGATFNIIFYSSSFDEWQKRMTVVDANTRRQAIEWVKTIEAVGATNIFDPLERAFELAGRGTHDKNYGLLLDTIYFMSDGLANRGRIIDPRDILKEIDRMNTLKKVKIHAIGIGTDHDPVLMRGLADLTGGTYISL